MTRKLHSLKDALDQKRQLGIRVQLARSVRDLADEDIPTLIDLLERHGVICLVNQPTEPRQLRDFVSKWGEVIELTAGLALANQEPGLPSITRVGNIRPDGSIIPDVRFAEYWHHDGDFWSQGQNFVVNFLNSVQVPETGGHTGFLDTRLAYEKLDESQRTDLADATICVRASEISDFKNATSDELPPDVTHPVFFAHPLTQKIALYLPESSTGIQSRDGRSLGTVKKLLDSLQMKHGIVEHAWAEGDLLITDNLQVMHCSMGGYGDSPRLLYRCQARMTS